MESSPVSKCFREWEVQDVGMLGQSSQLLHLREFMRTTMMSCGVSDSSKELISRLIAFKIMQAG